MAWQTIGTTEVKQTSTVLGYVYLQYDDSSSGSNWNVRLITGPRSSSYYFNVRFDNVTVDGYNHGSVSNVTQNAVVVWSGSLSGGRTIWGSWSCPWTTGTKSYTISGTLPVKGGSPTDGAITYNSCTWNSITYTTSVSGWGGLPNPENHSAVLTGETNGAAASITNLHVPRREYWYDGSTDLSHQFTATTANTNATYDGTPLEIKGLLTYKLGYWMRNDGGSIEGINNTLRYLPPSPLQSIAYTQTQSSTNVTVNLTITGGSSANNYSDTVTTYYRYSTNGGSTYTGWASAGTGSTWVAKAASFSCNYGASVVVQAKQSFHGMDSEVKQISFTATSGTAPYGGTVTVNSSTWNTVTLTAAGVNYGKPDSISGRKLAIGVGVGPDNRTYKRENQPANTTGATTTLTNSSIYPEAQPLDLKGMLPVYPYVWAWNTVTAAMVVTNQPVYYLPPAPGQFSYTDPGTVGTKTYSVTFTGVIADNYSGYDTAQLTRTVRYKVGGGPWVDVEVAEVKTLNATTTFNVTVPAGSVATVEGYMTYRGKNSELKTLTISNTNAPLSFYGSVNGGAKKIVKFYGSVNGVTKKVDKIYGSVDGVSKEFYEDV